MKPLKLKVALILEQKDQDKRNIVVQSMRRQGLPEQAHDACIYRIGLDSAFIETQNENKPT